MKKISLLILGALTSLTCMSALAQPLKASEGFGITNFTDSTWTDISTDQCEGVSTPLTIKNQTDFTVNPIIFNSNYNPSSLCSITYRSYSDYSGYQYVTITLSQDGDPYAINTWSSNNHMATPTMYGFDMHEDWM